MVRLWHCFSHRLGVGDLLSRPGFGLFGQLVARANGFEEVAQATPESERWERICYICAVHMSIYTHVFAYTNTCISKDVKTYVRNIYIYIYTYMCVCQCIYIYIHTYVHVHGRFSQTSFTFANKAFWNRRIPSTPVLGGASAGKIQGFPSHVGCHRRLPCWIPPWNPPLIDDIWWYWLKLKTTRFQPWYTILNWIEPYRNRVKPI